MREKSLQYHALHPKGKIEVVPTKSTQDSYDLSLAYSPNAVNLRDSAVIDFKLTFS
ncbi:malate dehydrogenase, partial [Leptospira borgpetersenii]